MTANTGHTAIAPSLKLLGMSLAGTLLLGCAGGRPTHISQHELLKAIEEGRAPAIVDVRSLREYRAGHVPGALHIPFYALPPRYEEAGLKKSEPVVVYCQHGPRAGFAKLSLKSRSYEQVLYLEGHMSAWQQSGLPVEQGPPPHR
ncbi:MAG TPA: rhodanese-like domain-containing protein [Gammaproteobacteria bacterium]|nr:rhodanese-like domain-containing protein [Gammaproteobacteria bacterium]